MFGYRGKKFESLEEAKRYVEDLPYWAEAISKGGLVQAIFEVDGDVVSRRYVTVEGLLSNPNVTLTEWYDE